MADPLVSVIVRTHAGRSRLVAEALASIAAQHYRPIEVIVVEDGSDDCSEVVAALPADDRLHVRHERIAKAGRCVAGNAGLELATGELVNFLDDDDRLDPDHLLELVGLLNDQPSCVAAYARARVVPTILRSLEPLVYDERPAWDFRARPFSRWHLWDENQFPIQACLFKRSLYQQHGGIDVDLPLLEDWELWCRYLSDGRDVGFLDQVTSMFRLPAEGAAQHGRERDLAQEISAAQRRIEDIPVTVASDELRAAAVILMDDLFADSGWLTRARSMTTGRSPGRFLLLAPARGVWRSARAMRGALRRPSMSVGSTRLLDAAMTGRGLVETLSVREAKASLSALWRAEDLDRYLLLILRNRIGRTGLQTRWPVRVVRRRTGRGGAPPGAVAPVAPPRF